MSKDRRLALKWTKTAPMMATTPDANSSGWERPEHPMHAHFDCFSGAAGDMLLSACLDAAAANADHDINNDRSAAAQQLRLLDHITNNLKRGLPELASEFDMEMHRVWRGDGSMSAMHVTVHSIYDHAPAPVPGAGGDDSHEHSHEHDLHHHHSHAHEHSHEHSHSHNHNQSTTKLRNLPEIRRLLQEAPVPYISTWVRDLAIATFTKLAEAEAAVHGATGGIDSVHFHEVGAVDSIVDIVGTLLALEAWHVTTVSCSALPLGQGTVFTAHGLLPVPAPATLYLLQNFLVCPGPPGITGELVTPTAAALITTLLHHLAPTNDQSPAKTTTRTDTRPPRMTLRRVGVGAGTKDFRRHPNIVRILLGDTLVSDDRK